VGRFERDRRAVRVGVGRGVRFSVFAEKNARRFARARRDEAKADLANWRIGELAKRFPSPVPRGVQKHLEKTALEKKTVDVTSRVE
jgi:hypothetical protein